MALATPAVRHVLYLHGFASSPHSSKAARFERELAAKEIGFSCPDFNQPSFETLTVTRMLDQTRAAVAAAPPGPIGLIGSSLGAFVAVHAANDDAIAARIVRMILLAPALDFGGNRLRERQRDVGVALYEDAAHYDAFVVEPAVPTLIFQGTRDASVDPDMVRQWCATRPAIDLRLLDDEHRLIASMDEIWAASARFLGLSP